MKYFNTANWIWTKNSAELDDYAEFISIFNSKSSRVTIKIAVDSVYALYINDKLIKTMECTDYPTCKFVDIFPCDVNAGSNTLRIDVWHYGIHSSKHIASNAGLIFEVVEGNEVIAYSSSLTQSRIMNEFENGKPKLLTVQQGASFKCFAGVPFCSFGDSIDVEKTLNFQERQINNIDILDRAPSREFLNDGVQAFDFGKETVGLPDLEFYSDIDQEVIISFGEHLKRDGHVIRILPDKRDFSFIIEAKKGLNKVFNPLKRIACRYFEIDSISPLKCVYMGLRVVSYHHNVIRKDIKDELLNKIYDTCIYTLECCMHEHYEDCPWREQCLYNLDSRNQMICGYYAFEGFEYQRHNLVLLAKALRKNGLLSICSPSGWDTAIPCFSLVFFQQTYEYIQYSKDESILEEISDCLKTIMNSFTSRVAKNNLIPYFDKPFWNFYEWTDESFNGDDIVHRDDPHPTHRYEFLINAMYVRAAYFYELLFNEKIDTSKTKEALINTFFDKEKNIFRLHTETEKTSQLANAFACLIGIGNDNVLQNMISDSNQIEASLSMRAFIYDALLTEGDKYHSYIINDIKERYKRMLDDGATTVYETEKGAEDFGWAGSLCHGWSAMPVYYFNILLK